MPVPKNARFRVTRRGGHKIRLAIVGKDKVVEAKNLDTGKTHTPAEFKKDRLKKRMTRG